MEDILLKVAEIVFFSVTINDAKVPLVVFWLICAGLIFTIYTGFINLRGFKHGIDLVRGRYSDPNDAGEVSHFQALATAVSGTVGLGNISGVAVAITLGGPGAMFWMIMAGFLGMTTKFVECMLGVMYRRQHADGSVSGGPMYYLRDGVGKVTKLPLLGKILAAMFAIFCVGGALGGGNMVQSNQATVQLINATGGKEDSPLAGQELWIGIALAILVGVVIIGGIKSIARVTEKIVPFMAVLYVTACLIVILGNIGSIPDAIGKVFEGAFTGEGVTGGVIGALMVGFQRAAFSNEAGVGSASIAHSAVKTKEPATEGFVAILEPFIDTIVICSMTALAIIITGVYTQEDASDGVALTSDAFESVLPWFPSVLAVAVLLFAYSTMISWSYYGMKGIGYLFGDNAIAENVFKVVFCIFTALGATLTLQAVLDFGDAMVFAMSVPNVIGLYILSRVMKKEYTGYLGRIKSGEIQPVK